MAQTQASSGSAHATARVNAMVLENGGYPERVLKRSWGVHQIGSTAVSVQARKWAVV